MSELAGQSGQFAMDLNDLKVNFFSSPSNFFKTVHTIFGVITFQDFALPSLQNGAFDLQTRSYGHPVLPKKKKKAVLVTRTQNKVQKEHLKKIISCI